MLSQLINAIDSYLEDAKCTQLRNEILNRVHCRQDIADRLITLAKRQNPGRTERWYLEKVIWDLKRGR
jgi:hypothetical protein